ncbi:transketolase [Rhinocladiella mackenziei CBS 650.93]|uniref:transketolase n=1 Tax=Rhinocladiella mackenziei CBS 650.93 TaxID=1442369 RepID=A0A0D2IF59_9EURO|nr:transketolase [Rhinocladiella mackenziei CBS 650.93]KIX01906.1 transketolase [Rhinocladiella mackenziei CBS 650.93]
MVLIAEPVDEYLVESQDSKGKLINGTPKQGKTQNILSKKLPGEQNLVLRTFRILVADLCQQFKGGHPGGAMGMGAIGVALWKYVMRYAPHTPDFINRDRFILSNGHACLFQYIFLHLTGYKAMTFDQLKTYHSSRVDTLCPGHPEIEHEGIEVTTGPLGQGISNAVGLAMASKHLASKFNKPGFDIVSDHIWCMVGDACLQEGVGLEAISFAGHMRLNNLTVIYDNNQITCDGLVSLANTEDVNAKMRACGWNVIDIKDGCFDVEGIAKALEASRSSSLPTFVNVRTVIGVDSAVAGDAVAHGAALGAENVSAIKKAYGFDPEQHFVIPQAVRDFFQELPSKGEAFVSEWNKLFAKYHAAHPQLAGAYTARLKGDLPADWESLIPKEFPSKETASRASSGLVFNPIAEKCDQFMVGTADLSPSVNMAWRTKEDFEPPHLGTGSYSGRYIHYGVREHVMAAISNGLAAYHPGMFIPVTSSFFMFYLYAAPAVRMGALQHLQVIHAATHDSIGMGEDGPTHQPIELAALFRTMPNLLYIRPGDSEETAGAWAEAIKARHTPSIISTSRHALPQLTGLTRRSEVFKGAYVLEEVADDTTAELTLIGAGAELNFAVSVAAELRSKHGLKVRTVSFPCQRFFDAQPHDYKRRVLRRQSDTPVVVIEAYAANGWERYANAAVCMSTKRFGKSLPGPKAYEFFGFEQPSMVRRILGYLNDLRTDPNLKHDFVELTYVRKEE